MGHLFDLEIALDYLRLQGINPHMLGTREDGIVCELSGVVLTDWQIVKLFQDGRLDIEGITHFQKDGDNQERLPQTERTC